MKLESLLARSFRNIEREEISFSPGVNLIYGENAEGKTNLLEAVYYFARGKSFRGAHDKELCRFGTSFFEIEARFLSREKQNSLSYLFTGKEKKKKYNRIERKSASEMLGHFRAVLFCPEHLSLVKGEPQRRRDFLNVAISQVEPDYLSAYAEYQTLLEERNSLIRFAAKGMGLDAREFEVFSEGLSRAAARVTYMRYRYVEKIKPYAENILSEISTGRETISLSYLSGVSDGSVPLLSEEYAKLYRRDIPREIAAGYTLFGPHRDDLEITLSGHAAREYASQGQQRSITLALKLAEGEVSSLMCGEYPVFLFDDVMSELDEGRRRFLLGSLGGRQILITACDRRDFEGTSASLIRAEGGRYEAVSQ